MANKLQQIVMNSLLCLVLAVTVACSKGQPQNPQAAGMQAMPVKVMEAKAQPVNDASEYVATLKSRDSAVIMPQVEGQVTRIFVRSGVGERGDRSEPQKRCRQDESQPEPGGCHRHAPFRSCRTRRALDRC